MNPINQHKLNPKIYKTHKLNYDDIIWTKNIMNTPNPIQPTFTLAEVRELLAKAWEDGYTTSSGDSFHNKNTVYSKSDFLREFNSKYSTKE